MKKTSVAILFGGQSAEHEISLISARAIYRHIDRERYEPRLIFINRRGEWCFTGDDSFRPEALDALPGQSFLPWRAALAEHPACDIYFPVLHGPNGEDGRLQGLLELAGVPFVGADSLGSALAMDKVVAKILFRHAGLPVGPFLHFSDPDMEHIGEMVHKHLHYPLFVKPCALGSSVGISRVNGPDGLAAAVELAFSHDRKIVVEQGLDIREIEVAVMGNEEVLVSRPGELIPANEFYDYNDKYHDGRTQFRIPVELPPALESRIRTIARRAYRALFLSGMARVDLFLTKSGDEIYVNEINTIPGFTEISMFPKLWQAEGVSFTELVTRLIEYGFARRGSQPRP